MFGPGLRRGGGALVPITGSYALRGVVEDQAQRVPAAGADRGNAVPHRGRRPAARGGDRPVAGGEDQPVTLWDQRRGAPRLRPGPLLDQEELTPGVIGAGIAEVDHDLEREHLVPVQVAVQRVPAASVAGAA